MNIFSTNFIYVLIGVISVVLLFLIIVLTIVCVQRKGSSTESNKKRQQGYTEGRKFSSTLTRSNTNKPDLWIKQNGSRFAALNNGREMLVDFMDTQNSQNLNQDLKRFVIGAQLSTESPPLRYHALQGFLIFIIIYFTNQFFLV